MKKLRIGIIFGGRSGEHEVSVASAAAIFKHLDRTRFEPVAIRIEKDGRWTLPDRPPTALAASDVIEQATARGRRTRSAPGARRTWSPTRPTNRCSRSSAASRQRRRTPSDRPRPRRRLSRAARPVRRGRHGARAARARQRRLCRRRCPGLGGRHGQGGHEAGVRRARSAGRPSTASSAAPRMAHRIASADRGAFSRRLVFRSSSSPRTSDRASASRRRRPRRARHGNRSRVRVRPEGASSSRRCRRRGKSRSPCSATRSPRRPCAGEIVPGREFYDYEAKYLDDGSAMHIPAPLDDAQQADVRRMAVEAFRAVDGAGMARVDFLLSRRHRHALRQRGQHHSRVHDDQHVREALGRHGRRLSGAARSPDPARPRAPRREATPEDERGVSLARHAGRQLRRRVAARRRRPAQGHAAHEAARALRRSTTQILNARFDRAQPLARRLRRRRRAWPARCWTSLRCGGGSSSTPTTPASTTEFQQPRLDRDRGDRAVDRTASPTAEAWFYLGAAYGARVQWRVLRQEHLAAARDGKRIKEALEQALALDPSSTTRASASVSTSTTRISRRRPPGSFASCCCCPAATGTRACATWRLFTRETAPCCAARPTTSCTGSISGTRSSRSARSSCCARCARAYPRNPLFVERDRRHRGPLPSRSRPRASPTWQELIAARAEMGDPRLAGDDAHDWGRRACSTCCTRPIAPSTRCAAISPRHRPRRTARSPRPTSCSDRCRIGWATAARPCSPTRAAVAVGAGARSRTASRAAARAGVRRLPTISARRAGVPPQPHRLARFRTRRARAGGRAPSPERPRAAPGDTMIRVRLARVRARAERDRSRAGRVRPHHRDARRRGLAGRSGAAYFWSAELLEQQGRKDVALAPLPHRQPHLRHRLPTDCCSREGDRAALTLTAGRWPQ